MNNYKIILLAAIVAILLNACKKDDTPDPQNNDDNPVSSIQKVDLENTELAATGVAVVDANDNVYMTFGDGFLNEKTTLVCVGADKTIKWSVLADEFAKEVVMSEGKLYLACKNKLYAYNASDGNKAWELQISDEDASYPSKLTYKPCIDPQGNIIISMDAYLSVDLANAFPGRVISVSPAGQINWSYLVSNDDDYNERFIKLSSPIATANAIYIMVNNEQEIACALTFDGDVKNLNIIGEYYNGKFLCANTSGDVFMHSNNDMDYTSLLKCLDENLNEKWELVLPDYPANNGVIDADENLYIGCEDGNLYKFDAAGNEVWKSDLGKIFVRGEMILGADGNIYRCLQTPDCIDTSNGSVTNIEFNGLAANDLAMCSDGTIVFGDIGNIYFISTNSKGIQKNAQWAKYGCDANNSSLSK